MRTAWGAEWTGSEWVRWTELRLWLGILLLPPGLADHRFCRSKKEGEEVGELGAMRAFKETEDPTLHGPPATIRASLGHSARCSP